MRTCRYFLPLIVLLLVFSSAAALAETGPYADWDGSTAANGDCQVGNLNDPVGPPAPDIFNGEESYAFHILPAEQCQCAEGGFKIESISMLLYFEEDQIPTTFEVRGSLLAAVFEPASDCWLPGPPLCQSDPLAMTIDTPGVHQVFVPVVDCEAYPLVDNFFLSLTYNGGGPAFLPIDDQPRPCTEYINRGAGWEDMFFFPGKTGGGKHIVFGDIVCSIPTVGADQNSWDAVKALYR